MSSFVVVDKQEGRIYYKCHRSAAPRRNRPNKTNRRCKQSVRIGGTCPARIVVTTNEKETVAFFQLSHAGHTCSVEYLRLSKRKRLANARKSEAGVSLKRILDEKRESVTKHLQRNHRMEKKDLSNIMRDFNLRRDETSPSDASSLQILIDQQSELGGESPVYKISCDCVDLLRGNLCKHAHNIILDGIEKEEWPSRFEMNAEADISATTAESSNDSSESYQQLLEEASEALSAIHERLEYLPKEILLEIRRLREKIMQVPLQLENNENDIITVTHPMPIFKNKDYI